MRESRAILGKALVGVYLHGSAAMGCFNPQRSDIDLLTVVDAPLSRETKRRYLEMVVRAHSAAPGNGIEMSVLQKEVCRPFLYPTPFELHFSAAHLQRYRSDPAAYAEQRTGTDPDLAAHCTILLHRGICLWGKAIPEIFGPVRREDYWDSILQDVQDAGERILEKPTYLILNLCRVLAYRREGLFLSKREGGNWGLEHLPDAFHGLICSALEEYASGRVPAWDERLARAYAAYMLDALQS